MFDNVFKGKRVFITGHTGFKGSWLSRWLLELGAEVAGYSLYIPSEPSHFEVLNLAGLMKSIEADVRDSEKLASAIREFKPDLVLHLAAQALVRDSYDRPKLTFETNLMGTVNVLDALRSAPTVKAGVIITSDKCYENVEWLYGYREIDRLGGKDPYSASKACAEIAFSSYYRSFFASEGAPLIASTRAGNVIGGGDWAKDRIVPDCMRAWSQGQTAVVRNPGATRPWQHVLEPLSGYLALAGALLQGQRHLSGESFNFGPLAEVNQPVRELIEEMRKVWKSGAWKVEGDDTGKPEAGLLKLSCDKALSRLGWQATLNFEETIRMTAEWYLKYYETKGAARDFTSQQIKQYQALANERRRTWAKS